MAFDHVYLTMCTVLAFVQDGELYDEDGVLQATGAPVLCLEVVGPNLCISGVSGGLVESSRHHL